MLGAEIEVVLKPEEVSEVLDLELLKDVAKTFMFILKFGKVAKGALGTLKDKLFLGRSRDANRGRDLRLLGSSQRFS